MITKAIIQNIDYTKNLCRIRIPLFENAARNVDIIEADAQINIIPGIYNSYKTGDIVFIGFEENKMEKPVILGKLFVSASAEASAFRGNVSGNSLAITDSAMLPHSTIFNYDKIPQNKALYKELNTPKKLADSIIELQRVQTQRYQTIIEVTVNDITYKLYIKTSNNFTYAANKADESLYRLCTALKDSQAEDAPILLDSVVTENKVDGNTIYTNSFGLLLVQELSPSPKLKLFIDGVSYEITKEAIQKIQSIAIHY